MVLGDAVFVEQQRSGVVFGEQREGRDGAFGAPDFDVAARGVVGLSGAPVVRYCGVGSAGELEKRGGGVFDQGVEGEGGFESVAVGDGPAEIHKQVEAVGAEIEDGSGASDGGIVAPGVFRGRRVAGKVHAGGDDFPDHPVVNPLPDLFVTPIEALVVADHEAHVVPGAGVDHALRIGGVGGDGLFAEDVFAGLGRQFSEVGVGTGRGADEDGVEGGVGEEAGGVGVDVFDAKVGGEALGFGGIATHDGVQAMAGRALHGGGDVFTNDVARAEDAPLEWHSDILPWPAGRLGRMVRLILVSCLMAGLHAGAAPFATEVLAKQCGGCHNARVKQGGLDLSSREALLRGSEHGKVVTPGNPEESQLYKVVSHIASPAMPFQGKKLPDEVVARFAEWIRAGVPYEESHEESSYAAEAAKHWAFRRPVRPATGKSIDDFLERERRKVGVTALPEADRATLIRRVSVDLTGLLPTPEDVKAFVADKSPGAYEALVDRLLASPAYGEQWGRHWLDVWRYSDWYGYRQSNQVRYSQRHIWRWRDWTVESLNANKPYGRMVAEMLAGDELAPGDPDVTRATGYLARSWYRFNRNVWLQDTVDYSAASLLGLTLKCARCHNHKYDPIPQTDYYRWRAFFEPHEVRTDRVAGEADVEKNGLARVYDAEAARPTYRFVRGNEANPDTAVALQAGVPVLFGVTAPTATPVTLPVEAYFPDGRGFVPGDLVKQARAEIAKAEQALAKARAKPEPDAVVTAAAKTLEAARASLPALEARIAADLAAMATPVAASAPELAVKARELELAANRLKAEAQLTMGQHDLSNKKAEAAAAKFEAAAKLLKEPAEGYTPIGPKYPVTSTGRRSALAAWIASKENPLTARVAMNHMWMRHFGKPLVATVFNFGRSGKAPTHPELLDWLAVEFMERDWDMKAMHRLMVLSRAYRLQSAEQAAQAKLDPDNVTLWRANVRRMTAENVRDNLLALAGKLDRTMGGPEIDEKQGQEVYRRSLYFRHTPDLQMEMLQVFDAASPIECFERSESIVPQQALALANSKLSADMAGEIAASVQGVEEAFERVLGRKPTSPEQAAAEEFVAAQTVHFGDAARARRSLVHVLLNHNDFVTVR